MHIRLTPSSDVLDIVHTNTSTSKARLVVLHP